MDSGCGRKRSAPSSSISSGISSAEPFVAARGGQGRHRVAPRLPGRARRFAGTCCDGSARVGGEVAKVAVTVERASDLRKLLENARPDGGIDPASGWDAPGCRPASSRRDSARGGPMRETASPRSRSRPRGCSRSLSFRRIRPDAAGATCSWGGPRLDSLSPAMHNAGFAALGLNAVYVPIESRDVEDFRDVCRADWHGGRERDDSVQARRDAPARRSGADRGGRRRDEHHRASATATGSG